MRKRGAVAPEPQKEIVWSVHASPEQSSWFSIASDGNGAWIGVADGGTNRILKGIEQYI